MQSEIVNQTKKIDGDLSVRFAYFCVFNGIEYDSIRDISDYLKVGINTSVVGTETLVLNCEALVDNFSYDTVYITSKDGNILFVVSTNEMITVGENLIFDIAINLKEVATIVR